MQTITFLFIAFLFLTFANSLSLKKDKETLTGQPSKSSYTKPAPVGSKKAPTASIPAEWKTAPVLSKQAESKPAPAGSKKVVLKLRSVNSIVIAPPKTGKESNNKNEVT